jgi:hypothetical protein
MKLILNISEAKQAARCVEGMINPDYPKSDMINQGLARLAKSIRKQIELEQQKK